MSERHAAAHADPNCLFCKIAAGKIPCHKVYEDEHVVAFLDIGPLAQGHTLVVPRAHAVTLDMLPPAALEGCIRAAARIAPAVLAVTGRQDWNLLQNNGTAAGQVVMHVHFHIIPRIEGDALGFRWPAGSLEPEAGKAMAEAIRSMV